MIYDAIYSGVFANLALFGLASAFLVVSVLCLMVQAHWLWILWRGRHECISRRGPSVFIDDCIAGVLLLLILVALVVASFKAASLTFDNGVGVLLESRGAK